MKRAPLAASRTTRAPSRRGAAAVEFAVVAPLFFLIVLAMIELSRGIMVAHQLSDAARIGCRAAAVEGQATAGVQTRVNHYLDAVGIRNATVTVQVKGSQADASTAKSDDVITVAVSAPVSGFSWLPFTRYLTGSGVGGEVTLRRE